MATIQSSIGLTDQMSPILQGITNSLNMVISAFEEVGRESATAFNTSGFEAARAQLNQTEIAMQNIGSSIPNNTAGQSAFNNEILRGNGLLGNMFGSLKAIASTYIGIQGVKLAVGMADELSSVTARLGNIKDSLHTTNSLTQEVAESAKRARGDFSSMAGTISKIGYATEGLFSNDELIQFTENVQKGFVISGASAEMASSAMLQLSQAMASGRMQGDELRSTLENNTVVAKTLADHLGVPVGKLKEMGAEGKLSAEILKEAMLNATDEINEQFENIPITFGQSLKNLKTDVMTAFAPILGVIQNIAVGVVEVVSWIIDRLQPLISIFTFIINIILKVGEAIRPIITELQPLFGVLNTIISVVLTIIGLFFAWQGIVFLIGTVIPAVIGVVASAFSALIATVGWPLFIIAGVIGVIVALFKHWGITGSQVLGWIFGGLNWVRMAGWNLIVLINNGIVTVIEVFKNWRNVLYMVGGAFLDIVADCLTGLASFLSGANDVANGIAKAFIWGANKAVKAVNWIIEALNKIPGINLDKTNEIEYQPFDITSGIKGLASEARGLSAELIAKGEDSWISLDKYRLDYANLDDAFKEGYKFGSELDLKEMFSNPFVDNTLGDGSNDKIDNWGSGLDSNPLKGGSDAEKRTADATEKMAKSMEASKEDLKYLRDISEQEAISRYTSPKITINLEATYNGSNVDNDIDGYHRQLGDYLEERFASSYMGV